MQVERVDGTFDPPKPVEKIDDILEPLKDKSVKQVRVFNLGSEAHKEAIKMSNRGNRSLRKRRPKGWKKELKKRSRLRKNGVKNDR